MRLLMYAFIALLHIAAALAPFIVPWNYGFMVAAVVSSVGWFAIFLLGRVTVNDVLPDCHHFVANYTQVFAAFVGFSALFWVKTLWVATMAAYPLLGFGAFVLALAYFKLMHVTFMLRRHS